MYKKEATKQQDMLYIHKPSHNRYMGSICTRGGQPTSQLWYDEYTITGKTIFFLGYANPKILVCLSVTSFNHSAKSCNNCSARSIHRKTATYNYYKTTKDQSTKSTGMGGACSYYTAPRKKILKSVCRKMLYPTDKATLF